MSNNTTTLTPNYLTSLPDDLFVGAVVKFLEERDIRTVACASKGFAGLLSESSDNKKKAARVFAEVTDCSSLKSMKTLRRHLRELQLYCPRSVSEGTWTIAEVLRKYNLKTIDFSQETLTAADRDELIYAFNYELMKPDETIFPARKIGEQVNDSFCFTPISKLTPDEFRAFNKHAGIIPESACSIIADNKLQRAICTKLLNKHAWLEIARLFQDFQREQGAFVQYIDAPHEQETFGDIEIFNWGLHNPSWNIKELKRFLKAFCPRLRSFTMRFDFEANIKNLRPIYQFFLSQDHLHKIREFSVCKPCRLYTSVTYAQHKFLQIQKDFCFTSDRHCLDLDDIQLIAENSLNIQQVYIDGFYVNPDNIAAFTQAISAMATKCTGIQRIGLCNFSDALLETFSFIAQGFPNLKHLSFVMTDDNASFLSAGALLKFLKGCPGLKSLSFEGQAFAAHQTIDGKFLADLSKIFPDLEQLELNFDFQRISLFDFCHFIEACPNLCYMSLFHKRFYNKLSFVFEQRRLDQKLRKEGPTSDFIKACLKLDENELGLLHFYCNMQQPEYTNRPLSEKIQHIDFYKPYIAPGKTYFKQLELNSLYNLRESYFEKSATQEMLQKIQREYAKTRLEALRAAVREKTYLPVFLNILFLNLPEIAKRYMNEKIKMNFQYTLDDLFSDPSKLLPFLDDAIDFFTDKPAKKAHKHE